MIKLLVSDLDGTLLNKDHRIDDTIHNNLAKVRELGGILAVASGREPASVYNLNLIDTYYICMNGSLLLTPKGEIVYEKPLDKDFVLEIAMECPDVLFYYAGVESTHIRQTKEEMVSFLSAYSNFDMIMNYISIAGPAWQYNQSIDTLEEATILKITSNHVTEDQRKRVNAVFDRWKDKVINAPASEGAFEFTDITATKGYGVKRLQEHFGLKDSEIAVYGDSSNDYSMLSLYPNAFVPSNGTDEAKALAKEVLGPSDEYSVSRHMIELMSRG